MLRTLRIEYVHNILYDKKLAINHMVVSLYVRSKFSLVAFKFLSLFVNSFTLMYLGLCLSYSGVH